MSSSLEVSRPQSIAELAEVARQSLGDNIGSFDFKTVERMVEKARQGAENFRKQGKLESASIELTRAVAIVSNKIPSHPGMVLQVPTAMEDRDLNLSLVSYSFVHGWSSTTFSIYDHNFHVHRGRAPHN